MKRFIHSICYALNGWKFFFSKEKNGQLQLIITVLVITASFLFHINNTEWIEILLCICMVLVLEMINSSIEKIIDLLHPVQHPQIKWVKDVAAGAVLLAALISGIIGSIIFFPKIF